MSTRNLFKAMIAFSRISLLTAVILSSSSYGGEVLRSSSVFERADPGSVQISRLKLGDSVKVTGPIVDGENSKWLPVNVGEVNGWINAESIRLSEGDSGFHVITQDDVENQLSRFRYWFGVGTVFEATSGYSIYGTNYSGNSYFGANFASGFDFLFGEDRRLLVQFKVSLPWTNERAQGNGAGRISRIEVLPGIGYQLIAQKLEILAHHGLTYIYGQSDNFDAKIGFTQGFL